MAPKNNLLSRFERNGKEKARRTQMKYLQSALAALVHPQPFKISGPEVLDQATSYIRQLQDKIDQLKRSKEAQSNMTSGSCSSSRVVPVVETRSEDGVYLELNFICGFHKKFMLHEVVSILQEGGAEVVSLAYHNADDRVFYTIRSQAIIPRIGMEISTIQERLKELVC